MPRSVQCIITSAVQGLLANSARRFSYVETAFFYRWWSEQSEAVQAQVKQLVASGQLEFINGGWRVDRAPHSSRYSRFE